MQAGESSDLFNDEVFRLSQEWKLSTSGLSAGNRFMGTGSVFVHNLVIIVHFSSHQIWCSRQGWLWDKL